MNTNLDLTLIFECPVCDEQYEMDLKIALVEGVPYCDRPNLLCRKTDMELVGWKE